MSVVQVGAWVSLGLSAPASWWLASRAVGRDAPAMRILCATVAYAALVVVPIQIEATLELVGIVDRVSLWGPALVSCAVLLAGLRWRPRIDSDRAARVGTAEELRSLPGAVRAAGGIVVLVYLLFAVERLTGFPASWDSVRYHLPVAADWLGKGSLGLGPDPHYYEAIPANGDLFSLVALATGWTSLSEAWNLVSLAATVSGACVLARVIGVSRPGRAVTGLVVASLPIVLFQSFSAYVDLFVAGFLVASVALLAHLFTGGAPTGDSDARHRLLAVVVAAGLACGLAVGAKATAWPTGLLVAVAGVGWILFGKTPSSRRAGLLVAFGLAVAAPCVFWFARNWAATGNPAFPMELTLLGHQFFDGTSPAVLTQDAGDSDTMGHLFRILTYPWSEVKGAGYPFTVGDGLGPAFATLVVPGVLYTVVAGLGAVAGSEGRQGEGRTARNRLALAAFVAVLAVLWWTALTPVWRFALPWLILACVLAGPFFDGLRRSVPRLAGPLVVACFLVVGAASALPVARSLAHRTLHSEWSWSAYYHLPAEYSQLPVDATVVNADVDQEGWNNFSLLGPELRRRVIPDWETERRLRSGDRLAACGVYVVDRAPFQLDTGSDGPGDTSLRLLVETEAQHGDERWRIWRGTARPPGDGCPDDPWRSGP